MALRRRSHRLLNILFDQIFIEDVISRSELVNFLSELFVLSFELDHRHTSLVVLFLDCLHVLSQLFVTLKQLADHVDTLYQSLRKILIRVGPL